MSSDATREPRGNPASPLPWLIVMAASAGGLEALRTILSSLGTPLPAAIVVILHRTPHSDGALAEIFGRCTGLRVAIAFEGQSIEAGVVYLARPDLHLTITADRRFLYTDERRIRFVRSPANPLLASAAQTFGKRLIAVVLSGTASGGTNRAESVKAHGGLVIAQAEEDSGYRGMPAVAAQAGAVDYVLPLAAIAPALDALVHGRPVTSGLEAAL